MRMHDPGDCPAGHSDCNGLGVWGPDPFAMEIYNDETPMWECEGELYESAMDI